MSNFLIWAVLNSAIIAGSWVAIVMFGRHRRLSDEYHASLSELEQRIALQESQAARLSDVESRLEFAERLLAQKVQSE